MAAGYSINPLYKKLGIKPGLVIKFINEPKEYKILIGDFINQAFITKTKKDIDLIHFFVNKKSELEKMLPILMKEIKKNGAIWVSWYKKSANKSSELTDNIIRDIALSLGLVDIKVCAVTTEWSGLKLVYRLKDR